MTQCRHTYEDAPDGLVCTRTDSHDETVSGGHTYASTSVADAHDASEAAAERRLG